MTASGNRLLLLNDQSLYNLRYRSPLMQAMQNQGYRLTSAGLFDTLVSPVRCLLQLCFFPGKIVSSNLKANLFCLLVFWRSGLVILNGMGRYRQSRPFRVLLLVMLKCNAGKRIAVQNYADYRYLKRHSGAQLHWVPGSGGQSRDVGDNDRLVVVSRDEKLATTAQSIRHYFQHNLPGNLVVVGCSQSRVRELELHGFNTLTTGYVPQQELFKPGGVFLQPQGYGEGIPHTLVDALVSGMPAVIGHRQFVSFGLHRLGFTCQRLNGGWLRLHANQNAAASLSVDSVIPQYLQLL